LDVTSQQFNLYASGSSWFTGSGYMNMYCSGAVLAIGNMPLYSLTVGTIDSSYTDEYGSSDIFGTSIKYGPTLYVDGRTMNTEELSLYTENLIIAQTASGNLNLITQNNILSDETIENFNLYLNAKTRGYTLFPSAAMSLSTQVDDVIPSVNNNFNLYVKCEDFTKTQIDTNFNLFVMNYLAYNQQLSEQTTISWNKDNVGYNIDLNDNPYATLSANDEIRGVDLICYGNCDTVHSCKEKSIFIHDKLYTAPEDCIDGGISRASNTYTNLTTSGFNTNIGYSGHFYGIRKYTDLIPSSP
jgi:hypothetical protein